MRKFIAAGLAGLLAAGTLVTSAEAHDRRYRHSHRNNDGAAVAAGIAGLAIGAALASNGRDRHYDRRYDDRRYYGGGYYRNGYYDRRYYAPPRYAYGYAPRYRERCRTITRWDPYYGQRIRVRECR